MTHVRRSLPLLAILGFAACRPSAERPAAFDVSRASPALPAAAPLLLNDALTVYFTAPVLPISVTADSFTVVDDRGQRVPGSLRVGADWVSFVPQAPVTTALDDGSFRPGAHYELRLAGMPRPDAVRSLDGRRLVRPIVLPFRAAARDEAPAGLPAPLRPLANDLPFVQRPMDGLLQLPADAPRLVLSYTQPLLPASVTADAFEITLLDQPPFPTLWPRSVRVLPSRRSGAAAEEPQGAMVEIDLGSAPRRADGAGERPLRPGDRICVQARRGRQSLRDYSGAELLAAPPLLWSVVAGTEATCAEWPARDDALEAGDGLAPSFELHEGFLRPCLRQECGDGRLGVLRPQRDLVLRPGQPFDRGDGAIVISDGVRFPFLAIEVPAGVTLRVEAGAGGAILQAVGSVKVAGRLVIAGQPLPAPTQRFHAYPVLDLAGQAPVGVVAAGPIAITGRIAAEPPADEGTVTGLFASATCIDLRGVQGELPFHTLLAVDAAAGERSRLLGVRGQSLVLPVAFTYGLPAGATVAVEAVLPWRALPLDRSAGALRVLGEDGRIQLAWQTAPADPLRRGQPDVSIGRVGRLQAAGPDDLVPFAPGDFLRLRLAAQVASGDPMLAVQVRLAAR